MDIASILVDFIKQVTTWVAGAISLGVVAYLANQWENIRHLEFIRPLVIVTTLTSLAFTLFTLSLIDTFSPKFKVFYAIPMSIFTAKNDGCIKRQDDLDTSPSSVWCTTAIYEFCRENGFKGGVHQHTQADALDVLCLGK